MKRDTFERLKKLGIDFDDDFENMIVKPLEDYNQKTKLPTISFKDKKLKSIPENSKYLLEFLISGEYVRFGGTNHSVELFSDSKLVTFSTVKWDNIEEGFTIKTNITTKQPEIINIGFKIDGKETNSLNLVIIANQEEEPKECLCKKTSWSEDDLKYIVTQLRKLDAIMEQAQYNGKDPYYIDKDGKLHSGINKTDAKKLKYKKYKKNTSFYDRNDNVDGKPLKDRIFFYDSDKNDDNINYNLEPKYAKYEVFSKYLNDTFKHYEIEKCIQKIHFLAQIYVETNYTRL